MNIQFIGHSTFLLEHGDTRLLIDPFIQGNPQATVTLQDALNWNVTAILITHAHGDHWGDTLEFTRTGTPLIATAEIAAYAQQRGAAHATGMNIGGTYRADWGNVTLTPAWHSSSFPDGTYGGMPTGLIVELGGQRVYHAGDTNLFGDMTLIGDRGLDAALLPIGDHYTMGPEEAARTLDLLRPRVAIPMHYGTFPPLTGDPAVFQREGQARGVDVRILAPGEHTTL
ncbi:metal-dependent hydrolase [Deinococcus sp. 14RED07]|uniref:metal-dependent hydrolase n=1 Tax=unclassified Deinococcus TaxID=2623546 RepID=UPI001E618654|nr:MULTISPECIES: metal-dependent hydrolase [unclassified Deinococcus]MCD0157272.1 metal-dependent hydrolase [Deinococcus sp. 6GRE01]MCD0175558.1 metal-dependent hydrolase [Deinococcus sp. 14RED07]